MSSDENVTYIIGSESFITEQRLIQEVEKTPLLWDKTDKNYNNRAAKEREWERIGTHVLNKNKDFVKSRWRNLRDQFTRELKKVIIPFGNPTKPYIEYYRGKWMHFEPMMFLRDILLKNTKICNSPAQDIDIHEEDMKKKDRIVFEDDLYADQTTNSNSYYDNYEKEPPNTNPGFPERSAFCRLSTQPIKIEILDDEDECIDKGVKRPAENNNAPPVPAKMKKPSEADVSSNTNNVEGTYEVNGEVDDDLHFVTSLVPYLRRLNPIRKLIVRNEIQSLLIRESLCENCKSGSAIPRKYVPFLKGPNDQFINSANISRH